jgi:uracil-DNA glycosylase family 4
MFTGDNSGIWLYRALFKARFANQPEASHLNDGLKLQDCYVTAALRCAPPKNKPTPKELLNCRAYLLKEILLLRRVCVVVGLGRIGFEAALSAYSELHRIEYKVKPKFSHCATYRFDDLAFIASFHPSQQNTFTGKLTRPMFDRVFTKVRQILNR